MYQGWFLDPLLHVTPPLSPPLPCFLLIKSPKLAVICLTPEQTETPHLSLTDAAWSGQRTCWYSYSLSLQPSSFFLESLFSCLGRKLQRLCWMLITRGRVLSHVGGALRCRVDGQLFRKWGRWGQWYEKYIIHSNKAISVLKKSP